MQFTDLLITALWFQNWSWARDKSVVAVLLSCKFQYPRLIFHQLHQMRLFPKHNLFQSLMFLNCSFLHLISKNRGFLIHSSWMETILNRSENPPTRANHFMSDIIASRLAFCSMFQYSRTAFWLIDDVRIFAEFLFEISKISQKRLHRIKSLI